MQGEIVCNKTNNMHLENRQDTFSFHVAYKVMRHHC